MKPKDLIENFKGYVTQSDFFDQMFLICVLVKKNKFWSNMQDTVLFIWLNYSDLLLFKLNVWFNIQDTLSNV